MAEATVSFAVERLGDLLIQEASFLYGVTNKVAEIQAELRWMKCFLKDADAKQDEDEMICNWIAEIREAAYDAEDVIQAFAFRVALRRRRGLQNILKSLTASLQRYDINKIREGSSSSRNSRQQLIRRPTYSHLDDKDTIGVGESTKILVERLVEPDKRCSVVCIYGMGGLGKTTLARKVYHHVRVRRHFDHFAWSPISQYLDIRAVVQGILIKLISPSGEQRREIDNMSDDEVLERLYKIQEEKKCLVVLDDVWRRQDWESLRPAFPIGKEGSRIVVTTRCQAASIVDPNMAFFHQPKFLTGEESWELLQRKALPTRNDDGKDPSIDNVEELGKEMVRYCGGLPLAIVVLGGLLATKHTFYEWERVQRNIKSYLRRGKDNYEQQGSGVSDVLALSYQDLPYYLKSCFLYLANFPEDYEIPTRPLVQMWVAEGIISEAREETLEDVAEGYLDELIGRCMVQAGRVSSNGRVKTCRLHDLMQDLCSSKAKEENFLEIINLQEVETFSSSRIVNRNEGANSNANLNNFKLLRVLSLEGLSLEEKLPRAIGNLIHLKYLSLKYAKLLCFPSSIRNLSCIQTLDLRFVSVHRVQWDSLSNLETVGGNSQTLLRNKQFAWAPPLPSKPHKVNLMGYLHVSYIDYLRRLRVDKGAMPNLKSLTIVRCKSLEMVPEGLRYITTLQALEIKYMHKEFMERLQVINGKEGEDFYKVQHVASISLIVENSQRGFK
ncbi:unnamed protein product, partial [Vitis vinifera]